MLSRPVHQVPADRRQRVRLRAGKLDMDRYTIDGTGAKPTTSSACASWTPPTSAASRPTGSTSTRTSPMATGSSRRCELEHDGQPAELRPGIHRRAASRRPEPTAPRAAARCTSASCCRDYSIVGARAVPRRSSTGAARPKVTYDGGGGVSLSSFFSRLAFAVDYKQTNFLLNNAASAPGAKIIFNRDPRVLVQKVAPLPEASTAIPYPVIDPSIRDTSSGSSTGTRRWTNYPYSQRQVALRSHRRLARDDGQDGEAARTTPSTTSATR